MSILANSNAISTGLYTINNSLRFRSSASAYLSRTNTSTGSKIFTHSFWVKRGTLTTAATQTMVGGDPLASYWGYRLYFDSSDLLQTYIDDWTGSAGTYYGGVGVTSRVFRDPSAWYHIVVSIDGTAANQTAATKIYVNGTLQTMTYTAGGGTWSSANIKFNEINMKQYLGAGLNLATTGTVGNYLDGYMAEINFIDGQALTPSSFEIGRAHV